MATKGYYQKTVRSATGAAVNGASVTINQTDGSPATVEDAAGATLTQPLTTDANGVFSFYALFGTYDIEVANGGEVVELPLQLIGPDQASLASAGSVIGQTGLFATGLPLGDYVLLDGAAYNAATYPDLAPLMTALPPSYTEVAGTPTLAGIGNGIFADADYVYIAQNSSPYLTILNRADFTVVSGTPTLPNDGNGVFADADYVYIGHSGSPYLTILNRADFTVVSGTPTLPGEGLAVFADADYVYIGHTSSPYLTILNRADFTVVAGTPSLASIGYDVFADADYVYIGHDGSPSLTILNRSDFTVVSGTPVLPNDGNGVFADADYVYIAHDDSPFLTILNFLDNGFEVPTVASPDPVLEYRIRAL